MNTKQDIMRNTSDTHGIAKAADTANTLAAADTRGCGCAAPAQDKAAPVPGCGWLKLYRCFTEWEWYSDTNTVRLFLHLLLKANYREHRWKGRVIPRGSVVTSLASLAAETSLSVQNVRTCLARLKSTGEINIASTACFTVVSINNYARYQDGGTCSNTPEQQTSNTPSTSLQQTSNKPLTTLKESKKEIKKESKNIRESSGFAKAQPALAPQAEALSCEVVSSRIEPSSCVEPSTREASSPCSGCKIRATDGCAKCQNTPTLGTNTEEKKGAGAAAGKAGVSGSVAGASAANASAAGNSVVNTLAVTESAVNALAAGNSAVNTLAVTATAVNKTTAGGAGGCRRGAFTAPDVAQVRRYAEGKGLEGFDAEAFTDYYTANGWRIGHSPMRDWQAAVRNWARRQELMDACTLRRSGSPSAGARNSRNILNVNDQWKGFALPKR